MPLHRWTSGQKIAITEALANGLSLKLIAALAEPWEDNLTIRALAALDEAGICTIEDLLRFYSGSIGSVQRRLYLLDGVGEAVGNFILSRVPIPARDGRSEAVDG